MNYRLRPPSIIENTHDFSALLDLIARKAPLMMLAGGGALSQDRPTYGKPLPRSTIDLVRATAAQGKDRKHVSEQTGVPYTTVCRILRGYYDTR